MYLENEILGEIESEGVSKIVQGWVEEWKVAKKIGLDNTLHSLANMYDIYRDVRDGKISSLEPHHVRFFGQALEQLKIFAAYDKGLRRYIFLLPSFEKAYAELVKYVASQGTSPSQMDKKSA